MDRIKRLVGFGMLVLPLVTVFYTMPPEGKIAMAISGITVAWIILAVSLIVAGGE